MPDVTYKVDDFEYLTDGLGWVVRTRAFLKNMPGVRNGHQQTNSVVWKVGDKALDDGGHIIAVRFLGSGEQINYYPLKKELNCQTPYFRTGLNYQMLILLWLFGCGK